MATLYDSTAPTAKRTRRVLSALLRAGGGWVAGEDLILPEVGGVRAAARVYDLRRLGWPIERRRVAGRALHQYRIEVD